MGFSITEMLRRYLTKYDVLNTRIFSITLCSNQVNNIHNCLFTNIFNVQNDAWLLWQKARNQEFFRVGEFSWNKNSLINILTTTHERIPRRVKFWLFVLETLKAA